MTALGRPPGALNERDGQQLEQLRQEEESRRHVQLAHRNKDLQAIWHRHRVHGMSRKRLVEIYGRDLVDHALTPLPK